MGQIHVYIIFSIPMKILLFIDPVTAFSSLPGIPNWKFVTSQKGHGTFGAEVESCSDSCSDLN
jgi:hypothetical protein